LKSLTFTLQRYRSLKTWLVARFHSGPGLISTLSPIFRAVEPVRAAARSVVYVFLVNADLQQRPKIKVPSVE
jgi:hypothetical protein